MPFQTTISAGRLGNSIKITLPKPACEGLGLKPGDTLILMVMDSEMVVKRKI